MKLHIMTWNIHGLDNFNNYQMPEFVINTVLSRECDIVILTEFIRNNQWSAISRKLAKKYWRYTYPSKSNRHNEILILVKKGIDMFESNNNMDSLKSVSLSNDNSPNYLQISLKIKDGKILTICGVRIINIKDNYDAQYEALAAQLNSLIKSNSMIVGGGDFNAWKNYVQKKLQQKKLQQINVITPPYTMKPNDFSTLDNWSAIPKDKDGKIGKALIDHFITSESGMITPNRYSWDFVSKENGYKDLKPEDYKSDLLYLPDHAILSGILNL